MTEPLKNLSLQEKIEQHQVKIDKFEYGIGLPVNICPGQTDEFKSYLDMNISVLEKLSYNDCANISYRLAQFAIYIQRCLNRQKALSRTLKNKINLIIAPKISQYTGEWDLRRASAILDNDVTKLLNEELVLSDEKTDRLDFISNGIKHLSDTMKNIQFSKKGDV